MQNWGDELTLLLLTRLAGIWPELVPPEQAELIVVGSILEHMPPDWVGTVAGAGKLLADSDVKLNRANILALRGPLSAKGIPGDYVLGDPGLLAPMVVPSGVRDIDVVIVPHWSDTQLAHRFEGGAVVNPIHGPLFVISLISRAKLVVTSSLHGVIVADAFGIPRRIEMPASATREGAGFKFRDYHAAIGFSFEVGHVQSPPRGRIASIQVNLQGVFRDLAARALSGQWGIQTS